MQNQNSSDISRRDMIKGTSGVVAATALAGVAVPRVHASQDETIQVALVGCGGRGTGAAADALSTTSGPIKLVAMADVFSERLSNNYNVLNQKFGNQVDVPEDRRHIGFDGYRHAMDCLRPGDVVILATPPAFRWPHFSYAIEKGLNVFMEKPVTVDGPTSRRMFKLGEESVAKGLKVGVGLMCRHCHSRQELFDRLQNGEAGDLLFLRAYRQAGPTAHAFAPRAPRGMSELLYQIREFHAFLWASGGAFSDFLIHNIDECCWMKDAWPVEAIASGGRHYRGNYVDQNFDNYSVEYTFEDGTKLYMDGRTMSGCRQEFASYAHGSKGLAVISSAGHAPSRARIYEGQNRSRRNIVWRCPSEEPNPYQLEWDDLIHAIRNNTPYNEVKRGVEASLVTSMGRLAAHTGQKVTYEEMLNHEHEFAPGVDKLTFDAAAPLASYEDGSYPVPMPGFLQDREYEVENA